MNRTFFACAALIAAMISTTTAMQLESLAQDERQPPHPADLADISLHLKRTMQGLVSAQSKVDGIGKDGIGKDGKRVETWAREAEQEIEKAHHNAAVAQKMMLKFEAEEAQKTKMFPQPLMEAEKADRDERREKAERAFEEHAGQLEKLEKAERAEATKKLEKAREAKNPKPNSEPVDMQEEVPVVQDQEMNDEERKAHREKVRKQVEEKKKARSPEKQKAWDEKLKKHREEKKEKLLQFIVKKKRAPVNPEQLEEFVEQRKQTRADEQMEANSRAAHKLNIEQNDRRNEQLQKDEEWREEYRAYNNADREAYDKWHAALTWDWRDEDNLHRERLRHGVQAQTGKDDHKIDTRWIEHKKKMEENKTE